MPINPSINGWIVKYFSNKQAYQIFDLDKSIPIELQIRKIGLSYGIINIANLPNIFQTFKLTQEELAKFCFLQLLENVHNKLCVNSEQNELVESIIAYYELIIPKKNTLFSTFFDEKNPYSRLEKILSLRWKEHFFSQSKNNNTILNMLLLYIDVLAYEAYLTNNIEPKVYTTYLIEKAIEILIKFKEEKRPNSEQDIHLILFLKKLTSDEDLNDPILYHDSNLRLNFIIDFIICNSWDNEIKTLVIPKAINEAFSILKEEKENVNESINTFKKLLEAQNLDYSFYKSTNLLNNIVTNSTSYIEFLLTRNKTRLIKELQKNTQLMKLLAESTYRDLNDEEKKMVKNQTIDALKTIPSLAIFLMPGGTVLLPVILKFIPSLLPSSFNENKADDKH
ncbi:LETM1-related biofilm-associated protein [Myroides pelagicus]|uniref:LETM1-related biofilm-associated protein n=1 Tax=Myroides pelagicus TaxID=270914 RepID=UPI002DBE61CF|nr:LETM1-related biofilm-associated protein [Myroides pelagicus]MEC4114678.1 LETM1-related biofilm-associated protein [Myroides pelagicus]